LALIVLFLENFGFLSHVFQIFESFFAPEEFSEVSVEVLDFAVHPRLSWCDKDRFDTQIQT